MFVKKLLNETEASDLITISNDLINKAQWPRLSINEQRLVLYMLALVQKGDKDFQVYRISVKELANIIGTKHKDLYQQFDRATDGLMSRIIKWIEAPFTEDETLRKVTWCASADLIKGKGYVELSFHPHLQPFLLALKGNFTQYELRSVIRLKNHYALRIYQFLKYNQGMATRDHRESIIVPLDWLKEYLDADSPGYRNFSPFRHYVLEPAQKDIKNQTDLLFEFKPIKEGRRVEKIEFLWNHNPDYDQFEMPFMNAPLSLEEKHPEHISDEIGEKLQKLGFDNWQKVRNRLTDDDWTVAFADLDYEKQRKTRTNEHLSNPGGWLRSRLPKSGEPYEPTQLYQAHLQKERVNQEKTRHRAADKVRRKQAEVRQRENERRLDERITAKITALSDTERKDLNRQAREKVLDILPPNSPGLPSATDAVMRNLVQEKYKITDDGN